MTRTADRRGIGGRERRSSTHCRRSCAPTKATTIAPCRSSGSPASSGDGSTARRSRRDTGASGPLLLDARAAAYADVDDLFLVGLIEQDWPDRVRRSIFYPASLLTQLGWPAETERLQAARARFRDLLRLPAQRVSVSSFTLEDDAIVSGSSFLQEIAASGLGLERHGREGPAPFTHEALLGQANAADLPPERGGVARVARSRSPADDATSFAAAPASARRRCTRSATSSAISTARSSTSRRACCRSTRSAMTSRA